jgi:hypothetical protein
MVNEQGDAGETIPFQPVQVLRGGENLESAATIAEKAPVSGALNSATLFPFFFFFCGAGV